MLMSKSYFRNGQSIINILDTVCLRYVDIEMQKSFTHD